MKTVEFRRVRYDYQYYVVGANISALDDHSGTYVLASEAQERERVLVKAATKLVNECEAEFTLDRYWNADDALITRRTVNAVKKAIAALAAKER